MITKDFLQYTQSYGIKLQEEQGQKLLDFMNAILEKNKVLNLTAIKEVDEFVDKHLVDSLMCDLSNYPTASRFIDIGTGGGFPGIPLAIAYPDHHFTLLDSTAKKIQALDVICQELDITNVDFLVGRAEDYGNDGEYRESFDGVLSRGVANYTILLELCLPFARKNGIFYSWKAKKVEEEIQGAKSALGTLKSKILDKQEYFLLNSQEKHVIISVKKLERMDKKYPRAYNQIKAKPLGL